ncbi:FecR domain-containing protein [Breoghania sp. JC706]|uniref:FecR domain-containing protein n=1 Tax=Breoghania sp. JC706 TaxID=3117732 RepID=UPI003009FF96
MRPIADRVLAAGLAFALAGPMMTASLPVLAATQVGVTSAVNPEAISHGADGATRTITLGEAVIHNEEISTGDGGLVQILLADGTTFTVGPRSRLTIDSYVYDPDAGTARVTASLSKGFMRFIGGRTSKTEGGATIRTPIGTAGIRGAVVDIDLGRLGANNGRGEGGRAGTPPHVSLIFGAEVTLEARGVRNRLFQAGYSIVVDGGRHKVMRTPPAFLRAMQTYLAGRPGARGGAPVAPRDAMVQASGVDRHNSQSPLPANVPVPQPRPEPPRERVAETSRIEGIEQAAREASGGGASTGQARTDAVRVLTSRAPGDGGGNGILGGSAETDRTGALSGIEGKSGAVTVAGGETLSLPVYADGAFSAHAVSGVAYGGASYSGTAYVGQEGFRAYMLSDGANPLHVISGKPTADVASLFSSRQIRHYSLSADVLAPVLAGDGATIPFAYGPALSGIDMSGAVSSDLLVAGTPDNVNPDILAKALQVSLVIAGTGASQSSAIGVTTGNIQRVGEGGAYGLRASRGGSERLDAGDGTASYSGAVTSASSAGSGATSIFGSNGQNMVLTNDLDDADAAFTNTYNPDGSLAGTTVDFATAHVANLVSTETAGAKSYDGRTLTGYSSAAVSVLGTTVVKAGTTTMAFDAANGTFSATFFQFDTDGNPYNDELGFTDSYGGAVYLDDDRFASSGGRNRAYVVSADLTPAKIFDGGTSAAICTCSYLKWGWWGKAESGEGGTSSVHLGNWVIGDVTDNLEMPSSGTATYTGHAVGTVVNGSSQYIATGALSASMDFAARAGNVSVSDFDGHAFGSDVSFAGSSTFAGTSGATSITGSFVNDGASPAQGVIGSFTTSEGSWSASGIFAGDRN